MKTRTLFAVIAAAALAVPAAAEESLVSYQPEPDFDLFVGREISRFQAQDAFAGIAACRIVDSRHIRPLTLAEAEAALKPCLQEVSQRYAAVVTAEIDVVGVTLLPQVGTPPAVMGIALRTGAALGSPLLRDLEHALSLRQGSLLGHPAAIRRSAETAPAPRSVVQDALDSCPIAAVVRRIASSEDFIRAYGSCITRDSELKVREIHPAEGRGLAVFLVSAADRPTLESLNGLVAVNGGRGLVSVRILASSGAVSLP